MGIFVNINFKDFNEVRELRRPFREYIDSFILGPKRRNPSLISLHELEVINFFEEWDLTSSAPILGWGERSDSTTPLEKAKNTSGWNLEDQSARYKKLYIISEHAKTSCHSDPFRTEEIKGLAVLEREKELAVKRLQEE